MGVLDREFIRQFLTNNKREQLEQDGQVHTHFDPVRYRWKTKQKIWNGDYHQKMRNQRIPNKKKIQKKIFI